MVFINLVSDSAQIRNPQLLELFYSKIDHLSKSLEYLDRVGIHATIMIEGREGGKSLKPGKALETIIEVTCSDEGFKTVLEKLVDRFSHTHKELFLNKRRA